MSLTKEQRIANLARGREAAQAKRRAAKAENEGRVCPERPSAEKMAEEKLSTTSTSPSPVFDLPSLLDSIDFTRYNRDDANRSMAAIRSASERCARICQERNNEFEATIAIVPCNTCGRPVDIRKPGRFQIRTELDPTLNRLVNRYWCTQECLLGFASHVRAKEAEEKAMVKRTKVV